VKDGFSPLPVHSAPAVPRLGFIGYNSSTACQLTSEVAAHWLSDRFLGRLRLPSVEEMKPRDRAGSALGRSRSCGEEPGFFVGPWVVPTSTS